MQDIIYAFISTTRIIGGFIIDRGGRGTSGVLAFVALALLTINTNPARALSMQTSTLIGLRISLDTTLSAGVAVRLNNVLKGRVASQSGGNDYVRSLPNCTAETFLQPGCLTVIPLGVNFGGAVLAGFKNNGDKNFAGNPNNDDGRLNFQNIGDITSAPLKVLSEIEVNLSTIIGNVNLFARVKAYYDPVLYSSFLSSRYDLYDRGKPGPSGRRELGRNIDLLDIALTWDTFIFYIKKAQTGSLPFSLDGIPVSLKVGKLAANNWGEATFSFTGISQGIVLNVPAARKPGAQIKEIIETEYMVYGSVDLPFGVGIDAYYQFHHTPWTLNESDGPFSISDTPNPSSLDATYLWLSGSSTSGTFRRNCNIVSTTITGALPPNCGAGVTPANYEVGTSIIDYRTAFEDLYPRSVRAENIRLEYGDLLRTTSPVRILNANDQGQFGVQLSYYFPYLNGIEFNVSYQNIHSRLPYARVFTRGEPIVTFNVIRGTGTAGENFLNGFGCTGAGTGGFLGVAASGGGAGSNFIDRSIAASASGVSLWLDQRHFGRNLEYQNLNYQGVGRNSQGQITRFRTLATAADTVLGVTGTADSISTQIATRKSITHYDIARINCAIYKQASGLGASATTIRGALAPAVTAEALTAGQQNQLAHLSPVGTEYLTLQYNIGMDLFYPQNLKIIGAGFNMALPWLEWGLQAEAAWRPDTPLQQDVTEQIIANTSAQGTGSAYGDSSLLALTPLVTTSLDEAYGAANAGPAYGVGLGLAATQAYLMMPAVATAVGTAIGTNLPTAITAADIPAAVTTAVSTAVTAGVAAGVAEVVRTALAGGATQAVATAAGEAQRAGITTAVTARVTPTVTAAVTAGITATVTATVRAAAIAAAVGTTAAQTEIGRLAGTKQVMDAARAAAQASGFNSAIYKEVVIDEKYRGTGIILRDMINVTVGTTALYSASHMITRALRATQLVFLTEFNAVYFLQDVPGGWDGGASQRPIARSAKHRTLQCVRSTGTELPLGSLVGLDTINDFGCGGDRLSLGYTIYGYLDYNNIFGSAWRFRPSVAIRHGAYGNTPSPLPGWREDTLSFSAGLQFAFQNTWTLNFGYVGYFDVGNNDYNVNGGFDTASFSVSYSF